MSNQPNDATDTEREINGVKYVAEDTKTDSCEGCAGFSGDSSMCSDLPNCRADNRIDGRDLIFVAQTKEQNNG